MKIQTAIALLKTAKVFMKTNISQDGRPHSANKGLAFLANAFGVNVVRDNKMRSFLYGNSYLLNELVYSLIINCEIKRNGLFSTYSTE